MKKYLAVFSSREIHRVKDQTRLCNLNKISDKNSLAIGRFKAWVLRKWFSFDGCGHCWPEKHVD